MAAALRDTRANPFAALPHALSLRVFGAVSVEERLRCREVCRGWRATLDDHSLWLRLDLTRADGAACSEALLRAATARAGGKLQALRLTCCAHFCAIGLEFGRVVAANSATLQELRVHGKDAPALSVFDVLQTLRAATRLQIFELDVRCNNVNEAHQLLRNNPPFGLLRVRRLEVVLNFYPQYDNFFADAAAHTWLTGLLLCSAILHGAALDAVVEAALAKPLSFLELRGCHLSPASVPTLARLLGGNTLTELGIANGDRSLLDEPAAALLRDALRANTSLTSLLLQNVDLWDNPDAAAALLAALTGHPRLRAIDLSGNRVDGIAASAALGALVAVNATALQQLNISCNELGDTELGPLVEALRHNTYLRSLDCTYNYMSEAFARDRLLPAVRANSSLRTLKVEAPGDICPSPESACEAAALVAARAQQPRA